MTILRCEKVIKSYRAVRAREKAFTLTVEHLELNEGEIYVLLGPNGAGKTTFIKLILHLLIADTGRIELFGLSSEDPKSRTSVGYVPEEFSFPQDVRFAEAIRLFGALAGLKPLAKALGHEVITALCLDSLLEKKVSHLSKGELQLLAIAQALLGERKLLICDEPLNGLDPIQKERVLKYLYQLHQRVGLTLLFSTHVLSEAEDIYTSVILAKGGNIGQPTTKHQVKQEFHSLHNFFRSRAADDGE